MPYRTRMLEQLMRTILETQAAMLSAMTQMQQALLSGMITRKPDEARTQSEAINPHFSRCRMSRARSWAWARCFSRRHAGSRRRRALTEPIFEAVGVVSVGRG